MCAASTGYRVSAVDGSDDETANELQDLNTATFGDTAPNLTEYELEHGHWWLAYLRGTPAAIAFAGLKQSSKYENVGYLCRVGVMPEHRGHGLQRRLLRVREAKARRLGYACVVTDTTDNVASANSLIGSGYRLYIPNAPWSLLGALYWRKWLVQKDATPLVASAAALSLQDHDRERGVWCG